LASSRPSTHGYHPLVCCCDLPPDGPDIVQDPGRRFRDEARE
jgi:hypothetical protein